jgi:hypothetical protein
VIRSSTAIRFVFQDQIIECTSDPEISATRFFFSPRYRGALSHGIDPIPIHQKVSEPYHSWRRISGHFSISLASSVADSHQSRVSVDKEKNVI